jgi:hypothetical protein
VKSLKERLQRSSKSLFGTFEDVYADESAFFTDEELDLLHKPASGDATGEFETGIDNPH